MRVRSPLSGRYLNQISALAPCTGNQKWYDVTTRLPSRPGFVKRATLASGLAGRVMTPQTFRFLFPASFEVPKHAH